jgi:hypothetical protein
MSFIHSKSEAIRRLQARLFNSRFFTISVILHLFLVLMLGSAVIIQSSAPPADFTGGDGNGKFVQEQQTAPPPPPPPQNQNIQQPTVQNKALTETIRTENANAPMFVAPVVVAPAQPAAVAPGKIAEIKIKTQQLSLKQQQAIKQFTGGWSKGKGVGLGSDKTKEREFEFVAYLAKYGDPSDPARGGDWASTSIIKDGRIVKGSLPNLLRFMVMFSKGKIKANAIAEPLDLSSDDIFVKKPPFIFFTGHRNFVLTEREVQNLQKYIQLGGCIWGDSSLPGRRSRFDLAFRREMRRVIPDADKDWELLPENYPIYTKNLYYPEIKSPQPGLNFYKEPIYALKFGEEVAIIYTANDYGDMWRMAIDEKWQIDKTPGGPGSGDLLYTDLAMFQRLDIYYRGLELPHIINSYKFGTNAVIHLLTRWEDRLKSVPSGL